MAFINFGMANTLAQAKASSNKNKLFFPTDSNKIVISGKEYGGIDDADRPVSLTIAWKYDRWSDDILYVVNTSNFKQIPNAVVCNLLGSIIPMTFCYDQYVSKLIGMFVVTSYISIEFIDRANIYLDVDKMYVLQIDTEWDEATLLGLDTISIRAMDGTYVYQGSDDSSSSGSGGEPQYILNSDGTVSTDGTLNPDGTFTVQGNLNSDGTYSVNV